MDITKSVRSPELIALLDFFREEQKTLLMAIDCNAHNYTAEQKLLHKRRARKSYDIPLQTIVAPFKEPGG